MDRASQPYQDPGWKPIFLTLLTLGLKRPPSDADGVVITRHLFASLFLAGLMIGFVLLWIVEVPGEVHPGLAALVATLGLAGVVAARIVRAKPLSTESSEDLAGSYRTNFFLGFALSEAPLLIAFAICMWRSEFWPYLVDLPFYVIAMSSIAPGRTNLAAHQERIYASGSTLSLAAALAAPVHKDHS